MGETGQVFVYGTLKVGGYFAERFNHLRLNSKNATIKGALLDLGDFPGIKTEVDGQVHGEIHEYNDFENVVYEMDLIEGYSGPNRHNLFNRIKVIATDDSEEAVETEVIAYEFAQELPGEVIERYRVESGIWQI